MMRQSDNILEGFIFRKFCEEDKFVNLTIKSTISHVLAAPFLSWEMNTTTVSYSEILGFMLRGTLSLGISISGHPI